MIEDLKTSSISNTTKSTLPRQQQGEWRELMQLALDFYLKTQ